MSPHQDIVDFVAELRAFTAALGALEGKAVDFTAETDFEPAAGKALVTPAGKAIVLQGKVADFGADREDEYFEAGAFDRGLEEFMKNPILAYHHSTAVMDVAGRGPSNYVQLGSWDKVWKEADGLYARSKPISEPETPFLRDVYKQLESGNMRGASVGGRFLKRQGPDGKYRIYDVDLHEISVAPKPVNKRTLLEVSAAA